MAAGTGAGWPPTQPTAAEQTAYQHLEEPLRDLLREYKVAYATWAVLNDQGFHSVQDFGDRFPDKAAARANGPEELKFRAKIGASAGDAGWDAKDDASRINGIRRGQPPGLSTAESSAATDRAR